MKSSTLIILTLLEVIDLSVQILAVRYSVILAFFSLVMFSLKLITYFLGDTLFTSSLGVIGDSIFGFFFISW